MATPAYFEAAFDRLFPLAENTARAVVVDAGTAENVAIESLARALARWDHVGALGDPTAWVLRTAMALADKQGPQRVVDLQVQHRSPHELLELVQRRGGQLKSRRRVAIIGAVAVLVGSGMAAALSLTSSSSHDVVAGPATTLAPTTAPTFDETTVASETTTTGAPTTTVVAPATTVAAAVTTTSLACRNSSDPKCGAFRWDPAPGANQPISISVTFTPQDPHPGDVVTFTAHVVDPDASPIIAGHETCNPPGYGDVGTSRCTPSCAPPGYGPWTTPPRQRGERTVSYTHTYADTGSFTAHFWFGSSAAGCPKNPYASSGDQPVTVNVT